MSYVYGVAWIDADSGWPRMCGADSGTCHFYEGALPEAAVVEEHERSCGKFESFAAGEIYDKLCGQCLCVWRASARCRSGSWIINQ